MTDNCSTNPEKVHDKEIIKYGIPLIWCDHYESSITKESLRATVILSVCYLDEALYNLLKMVLVPIKEKNDHLFDGPQAPLGTFSAKIEMAFRMQLFDSKMKDSFHLVRKIRNEFAHNLMGCSFENSKILDLNR